MTFDEQISEYKKGRSISFNGHLKLKWFSVISSTQFIGPLNKPLKKLLFFTKRKIGPFLQCYGTTKMCPRHKIGRVGETFDRTNFSRCVKLHEISDLLYPQWSNHSNFVKGIADIVQNSTRSKSTNTLVSLHCKYLQTKYN